MVDRKKIRRGKRILKLSSWMFTQYMSFWIILSGLVCILIAVFLFSYKANFSWGASIDADRVSKFGDFIGGIVGSIWSLAGIILFYVALNLQRKEFRLQRQELRATRNIFEEQARQLKVQQRENTFFHLLDNHRNLVLTLSDRISSSGNNSENLTGYALLQDKWRDAERNIRIFKKHWDEGKGYNLNNDYYNPIKALLTFKEFHSLFLSICYLVKFVKEELENSEFHYTTIYMNLSVNERIALGAYLEHNLLQETIVVDFSELNFDFLNDYRNSSVYVGDLILPPLYKFEVINPMPHSNLPIADYFPKVCITAEERINVIKCSIKNNSNEETLESNLILEKSDKIEFSLFDFCDKNYWNGKLSKVNRDDATIDMIVDVELIVSNINNEIKLHQSLKYKNKYNGINGISFHREYS